MSRTWEQLHKCPDRTNVTKCLIFEMVAIITDSIVPQRKETIQHLRFGRPPLPCEADGSVAPALRRGVANKFWLHFVEKVTEFNTLGRVMHTAGCHTDLAAGGDLGHHPAHEQGLAVSVCHWSSNNLVKWPAAICSSICQLWRER